MLDIDEEQVMLDRAVQVRPGIWQIDTFYYFVDETERINLDSPYVSIQGAIAGRAAYAQSL